MEKYLEKNYRQLTESIKRRINPENFALRKSFLDELATVSYNEVLTYIRVAMKGVEQEYTQKSKNAGERVKVHLSRILSDVTFKYQGSVMTDTHIKGYSDIDLLTISDKFYLYDAPKVKHILESYEARAKYDQKSIAILEKEVNADSYQGNSLLDLRQLRLDSEDMLTNVYDICNTSNPKSIKIKNQNLNREVDVVVANWYDDVTSLINEKGDYRGIQVYNKETHSKEDPDYPFLSIKRINDRSSKTNGRLKRLIRFLKNVKADSSQDIELSSFDINAVCYDINASKYQSLSFYDLVPVIYNQLKDICTNHAKADSIISVDGREYVFKNNNNKLYNLNILLAEVEGIFIDLRKTLGL